MAAVAESTVASREGDEFAVDYGFTVQRYRWLVDLDREEIISRIKTKKTRSEVESALRGYAEPVDGINFSPRKGQRYCRRCGNPMDHQDPRCYNCEPGDEG